MKKTPRTREGESKRAEPSANEDYYIPDPRVIGSQYDILIDDSAEQRHLKENEERKTKAIFDAIEDHSSYIAQQENLSNQLEKKNREIEKLLVLLEACEPVPGISVEKFTKLLASSDENCDYRDSKIVDLAKKVRRLTVTINKDKALNEMNATLIQELNSKCNQLQQELDSRSLLPNRGSSSKSSRERDVDPDMESLSRLQKELVQSQRHAEEMKKKLAQTTEENKNLSRALARELGDGVTIEQAVDGGWRGRAQQIIMLKSKIKKLEAGTAQVQSQRDRNDVDSKAEDDLAGMSADRRMAVEAITEENSRLNERCTELENKVKGSKARIKNLENECLKQKSQLQVMVEKSTSDDELLDAFKEEMEKLQGQISALQAEKRASIDKATGLARDQTMVRARLNGDGTMTASRVPVALESDAQSEIELQRLRRLCKQQAEQLATQDKIIQQLRASQSTLFDNY